MILFSVRLFDIKYEMGICYFECQKKKKNKLATFRYNG